MSKPLPELVCFCPLLGVKRTKSKQGVMSAHDPKRTWAGQFCCDAQQSYVANPLPRSA
jgi:hypothetical protein